MNNDFTFDIVDSIPKEVDTSALFTEELFTGKDPVIKEGSPAVIEKTAEVPPVTPKGLNVEKAFEDALTEEAKPATAPAEEVNPFKVFYEDFKKKGILDEDAEFDGSEEKFVDLFFKQKDKYKESAYKEIASELGDQGLALIQHLRSGGSYNDLVETFANPLEGIDIEKPEDQKVVLREFYRLQNYTPQEIEEEVKDSEDLGADKLKEKSQRALAKINEYEARQKQEFADNAKLADAKRIEDRNAFVSSVNEIVTKKDDLFGIPIGKDKKALVDYITKPTVRLPDGRMVPKFQADRAEKAQDKDIYIFQALCMMKGFNFDNIKKEATTKATLSLKEQLDRSKKETTIPGKLGGSLETATGVKSTKNLDWSDLFNKAFQGDKK